jgi:hypothetical protein
MTYHVPANTTAYTFRDGEAWFPQTHWMQIRTKYGNDFNDMDILSHPNRICETQNPGDYAGKVSMVYSALGYFIFKRDGFILVVNSDDVRQITPQGIKPIELMMDPPVFDPQIPPPPPFQEIII